MLGGPSIGSMDVIGPLRLSVNFVSVVGLRESRVHVSSPALDWLRVVFVILQHLLVSVRIGSDTLSGLEAGLFLELLHIGVLIVLGSPGI